MEDVLSVEDVFVVVAVESGIGSDYIAKLMCRRILRGKKWLI